MPLSAVAAIPDALLTHLTTFSTTHSPALEVAYPDKPFTPTDGVVYLEAIWLPNRTETRSLSPGAAQRHQGLFQVSVMWPAGFGSLVPATDLAGEIVDHFDQGTALFKDGTAVKISRKPWLAPPLDQPGRLQVPVTVPYEAFSP